MRDLFYRAPCEGNGVLSKDCSGYGPFGETPELARSRAVSQGWTVHIERQDGNGKRREVFICPSCWSDLMKNIDRKCSQCDKRLIRFRAIVAGICDECAGFLI